MLGRTSVLLLFAFFALGIAAPSLYAQQTYTVNATGDEADANLGDGRCETSEGSCTLRAAIQEANQSSSEDAIEFGEIASEGEALILPKTSLPRVTETIVIDGTTEPNYTEGDGPVVVIAGDSLSEGTEDGLSFFRGPASGSRVQSIALVRFPEEGIEIHPEADEVTIDGCYIGVGSDGSTAMGNGGSGIWIGSSNNTVGTSEKGNVISGNGRIGIEVTGHDNEIRGNRIGVSANGEAALPNGSDDHQDAGILVVNGTGNDIVDNVIAGNEGQGIFTQGGSYRNTIRGNYIGTSRHLTDLGNKYNGIRIDTSPESNADRNVVRGENVVAFNRRYGISVNGDRQVVTHNYIGTNSNGEDLGNYRGGVRVAAQHLTLGWSEVEGEQRPGNVIGFNGRFGIRILEGGNHRIRGNYVGTNSEGEDLGNEGVGIKIRARGSKVSTDHQVGYGEGASIPDDPSPSANGYGNVIANNDGTGILFGGTGTTVRNTIRGNHLYNNGTGEGKEIGLALTSAGPTENDAGDADEGPNNLQNTPEFDDAQTQYLPRSGDIEVRYRVDSDPSHSSYGSNGLTVDFYLADPAGDRSGKRYLYTDQYPDSLATNYRDVSFEPPNGVEVSESDQIVATVTDANGNTSEFSKPSPLSFPVELANYKVEREGDDTIRLTWQTTEEVDNGRFRVEHQSPSIDSFTELDYVEGKGTSDEPQEYSYRVEDLDYGTHTFRLVHLDPNGVAYRLPERTIELTMKHRYTLTQPSPNPTHRVASFEFGVQESQSVRVALYDALGRELRVLYEGNSQGGQKETVQIDGKGLSSGRYFVRVSGDDIQEVMSFTLLR